MRRVVLPTILACLLLPAAAFGSGHSVIKDCTDNGTIDSYHSQADYKSALSNIPSDIDQYTNCRDVINAARRRDANKPPPGSGGGGGGSGGGTGSSGGGFPGATSTPLGAGALGAKPMTAAQNNALNSAAATAAPVLIGGKPITPGATGLASSAFRHAIPGPLLAVLIALAAAALLSLAGRGRNGRGLAPGGMSKAFDRVFPRRA